MEKKTSKDVLDCLNLANVLVLRGSPNGRCEFNYGDYVCLKTLNVDGSNGSCKRTKNRIQNSFGFLHNGFNMKLEAQGTINSYSQVTYILRLRENQRVYRVGKAGVVFAYVQNVAFAVTLCHLFVLFDLTDQEKSAEQLNCFSHVREFDFTSSR